MTEEETEVAVVRFLIAIAHADGRLDEGEAAAIRERISEISVSDERREELIAEIDSPPSVADAAANLKKPEDKMTVLFEAIRVAYADGEHTLDERKKIEELASQLGIPRAALADIEDQLAPDK
jgi:uncharacterized membrane protein YebE (DUF533 family)